MRRYQRRLLIVFGSLFGGLFVLFLLFNLLILNLFEGSVDSILDLVPKKGVSYFVATRGTGPAIDRFVVSSFVRNARRYESVEAFFASDTWNELESRYGVEENLDRIRRIREQLPFDVLASLFGDEIVVAGSPNPDTPNRWDYLVFTRIDWKTKIAVDFCDNALVRRRLDPSVTLARVPGERYRELSFERGGKTHRAYFARVRDVLVVSNKEPNLQGVMKLVDMGPGLSLGLDKTFMRAELPRPDGPDEFLYFVNVESLWEDLHLDRMLDREAMPGQLAFLFDYVNPERVALASGRLLLAESPELVSEFLLSDRGIQFEHEYRIFNAEPVELREAIGRFERFVPDDCFFFGYLKCPSKDLFTLLGSQVKDRGRELVDERLREKPRYRDFDDFLTKTAANFGENVALGLSRIDYETLPYRPSPAVTLFFEVEDHDLLGQFLDYLTGDEFALEAMSEEEYKGVTIHRGFQKLPLIEWADELAYATIDDTFVLSTSKPFLKRVVDVYNRHAQPLFATERFRGLAASLPLRCNGFGFWDFQRLLDWADDYKEYLVAQNSQVPEDKWNEFRAQALRTVMSKNPSVARELLDDPIEQEVIRLGDEYTAQEAERWRAWFGERIRWARALGGSVLGLAFATDRVQARIRLDFEF